MISNRPVITGLFRNAIAAMMRLTIRSKVFLATCVLSAVLVVLLALVMRWNLGQGFERYVSAAEFARLDWLVHKVETEYGIHGNWLFLQDESGQAWRRVLRGPRGSSALTSPPLPNLPRNHSAGNVPANDTLRIGPRIGLRNARGQALAGPEARAGSAPVGVSFAQRPLMHEGTVVGYLTLQAAPAALDALDATFLASQNHNLLVAALCALLLSALAAWLLSRHLLQPIEALHVGAHQISQGQLNAQIAVRGDDELSDLAATFNAMAQRLDEMETSRRNWIADTSHELRTPLAVLRAEIEALQDGVHTPDRPTLERMRRQTQQLTQLVDDLRLTLDRQTDAKCPDRAHLAPLDVLFHSLAGFQERFAGASIAVDSTGVPAGWPSLMMVGNVGRMQQVFDNLLENSLRYTNAGGRLVIASHAGTHKLTLHFDDTAPAPSHAALPHLLERFFRADSSRNRASGGSGLGLAICKALVEEHGGSIEVGPSSLGGLRVTVTLPVLSPPVHAS